MPETPSNGRHRSPGRYSPLSELSIIASRVGESSVKASAVLAASGGLVAAFALPANAATPGASRAKSVAAPTASAAPAVIAPDAAAPVMAETVGVLGVKAVARPRATTATLLTSRSASRAPIVNIPQSSSAIVNIPQSSSAIVNIARGLLGIPYVYGGESLSGFDCSGFTQYVYRQAGISIPRTASAQQAAAARVATPKPGDLVFFGSPAWHVGIYVGNGLMIDSAHSGTLTAVRSIYSGVSGYGRF